MRVRMAELEAPLAGRAGIITGAAGGLGRGFAEAFGNAGARLGLLDRDGAAVGELARQIGCGSVALEADITDEDQVWRAFDQAQAQLGRLDFLVNNAGIRYEVPFLEHDLDRWRMTLDVNLTGSFLCAQAAARAMVTQMGGGKIVNIASTAGLLAFTARAAYVASKAGVFGLTRAIAAELGPRGVYCNAIAPGVISTPLTEHYFDDEQRAATLREGTPLRRWGSPGDLGGAAVFLCSAQSDFVQGATIVIDGGWIAGKGY